MKNIISDNVKKHLVNCGINLDDDGRVKIDNTTMAKLKPMPKGNGYKAITLKDKTLMGFRARVSETGKRVFVFRYRPKGKSFSSTSDGGYQHKINKTIGPWFDKNNPKEKDKIGITPAVARKECELMKAKLFRGEDPAVIIQRRVKGVDLKQVCKQWLDVRAKNLKSYSNYLSMFRVWVEQRSKHPLHIKLYKQKDSDMVNRPILELTKDDYIKLHRLISTHAPTQANKVIEMLRLVERYAKELGHVKKTVVHFSKKRKEMNKEISRLDKEEPYTPAQLIQYRRAALKLIGIDRQRYLIPCMELLAASIIGARSKDQVFSLRWDQINPAKQILKYMDTKNDEPMTLNYDYRFAAILRLMNEYRKKINHRDKRRAYVFPAIKKEFKTKFMRDPRKTHYRIIKLAGLEYKCIHFLRHSWATNDYESHGDIKATKELGGWISLKSVEKYVNVSERIKKQRLEQQRQYLAKARKGAA